jgi:HK97 family phage portal protein
LADRRSFWDIIGLDRLNRNEVKRSTGYNFFTDDPNDSYYGSNTSFIQGYNGSAGDWGITGLGNGESNSAVVACLQVLGVSFSEATLQIMQSNSEGQKELVPNHALSILMRRPNPFMSGDVVQQYIINAMHVSGDAYLLKQKNEAGELVALYPLMPEQVTPKGSTEELIVFYEYETGEETLRLDRKDVVHFKLGLDPNNHKQGFSPLKSVLREIYGDESAGQMATALLANMGVPSVMITPKDEFGPSPEEAEQIAKTYQQKVSGKNKGKPLVMSGAMNVEKLSFSPKDLDIGLLRRVPEERVSAVLGVPAILAGLGAGLAHATYSNAKELREFFTENKLIPLWRMIGEEITQQILLQDYEEDFNNSAEYDFTEVRALQSDVNELFVRMNVGVQGGWITVAEAREKVGLPTNNSQEIYLISANQVPTPANMEVPKVNTVKPDSDPKTPEVETEDDMETSNYGSKVIKKIEDQFCVIAEDSGKNMGCYATRELAERRLEQISRYSDDPKAKVGKDEFTTIEEAEKRAEEIGCNGTHTHDKDGQLIYMPCATHQEYEQRTNAEDE